MQFSIGLPSDRAEYPEEFVTATAIMAAAAEVEGMGFDACCVTDHPVGDAKWLAAGGHHASRSLRRFVVRSGRYNAYSLTYTRPCAGLPQPASLCEVRIEPRCLVGRPRNWASRAGYLRSEFDAVGVDIDERNELTDEAIDVLRLVWSEDSVTYVGRHFRSWATTMRPHL